MNLKLKVIGTRFLKTFLSGFLGTSFAATAFDGVNTWTSLESALSNLLIAGIIGGVSAIFMASDKWLRWDDAI